MIALDGDQEVRARFLGRGRVAAPALTAVGMPRRRQADGELALGDELAVGEDAGALDDVAQLAHVAVPRRLGEPGFGSGRQAGSGFCSRSPISRTNAAVR